MVAKSINLPRTLLVAGALVMGGLPVLAFAQTSVVPAPTASVTAPAIAPSAKADVKTDAKVAAQAPAAKVDEKAGEKVSGIVKPIPEAKDKVAAKPGDHPAIDGKASASAGTTAAVKSSDAAKPVAQPPKL